ncbi:hypothetical protein LRS71_16275 [Rhodococcus pyridinivorans]|uniref:LEM-3-like GIY-YIG domain-containing protein n=1 Tax=Rhodococcus pyridinivorans TaxID=103816 RepID=UPI001E574EAF|nr:hypothetical protein [Rhodococcus pyridinivorans]MCD5421093.1 hypothetical protein [Rhodococcus pyridinivorans]
MGQTYYEVPCDVQDLLDEHPVVPGFLAGAPVVDAPDSADERIAQYLRMTGILRAREGQTFPTQREVLELFENKDSDDVFLCPALLDVALDVVKEKDTDPAGAEIAAALGRITEDQWRWLRELLDRLDRHQGSFDSEDPVGGRLLMEYAEYVGSEMKLIVQFDRDRWRALAGTREDIAEYSAADCIRHLSAVNNIDRWFGGFMSATFAAGNAQMVLHRLLGALEPIPVVGPAPLTPHVCAQLGTYVYVLVDSRDNTIFYAGKGRGNRIYAHVWEALGQTAKLAQLPSAAPGEDDSSAVTSAKIDRIHRIHEAGYAVEHWVVRHRITPGDNDDAAAFQIEQGLIDALRMLDRDRDDDEPVVSTNLVGGHSDTGHGVMRVEELAVLYGAEPAPLPLPQPSVVLRVNAAADAALSDEQIYEAARGDWRAADVLNIDGLLAFVIAHDVIRAVFRVESWSKAGPTKTGQKWKFTGHIAEHADAAYRGKLLRAKDLGYTAGWPQQGWARRT